MIIFFDIDGTLITEDGKAVIPKSTAEALKEASERGHKLYINTGRTYSNVEDKIRQLGFDGYVCGCGTYIECEGKVQLDLEVPEEVALKIRELAYECNVNAAFEHRDAIYIDERVPERPGLKELKESFKKQKKWGFKNALDDDFSFAKLVAWYDDKSDLEGFRNGTEEYFEFIDRGSGFLELAVKGYSKGTAIVCVCELYGANIADTVAVGDSMNDAAMIETAGHGVCMGNGREELKKISEFVTDDIYNDGLAKALRHYGIIL